MLTVTSWKVQSFTLPLELMGVELIEVLVTPNTIVETLDVIEDFRLGITFNLSMSFLVILRETKVNSTF